MRVLLLLGVLTLAACGPDGPPVTVEGVDPAPADGDLAPESGLAPSGDLAPDAGVAPDLDLAPADSL